MQGNARVIEHLNEYLRIELTGHKQYLLAAGVFRNWGFARLHDKQEAYSREETEHAAEILHRILFLEGTPTMEDASPVGVPGSVEAQLRQDHALVHRAIVHLQAGVELCRSEDDNASRELVERMLVDEEEHLDWLESQLELIRLVGAENYLQQQIGN